MTEKTNKATLTTSIGTGGHNNKPLNQFEITTVTLSAVEWLQEQYNQCPKYEERICEQDWEKAKEMEKEQIEKEISDEEIYEIFNRLSSYLINVNSPLSEKEAIIVGMKLYREQIKTLKSE